MTTISPSKQFPSEPLAIVGVACRLPGADNVDEFWNLLSSGGSGIREMPAERLDRRLFFTDKRGEQSKTYSTISGLIPPRPQDPSCDFRTRDLEALKWDPCHEILCDVVDEARQDAGWSLSHLSGPRTGVYVGHSSGSALGGEVVLGSMIPEVAEVVGEVSSLKGISTDERREILLDLVKGVQQGRPTRAPGGPCLEAHIAAQLIAKRFQLDGPQLILDAACASSLVALACAAAALTHGEIDQAIVSSASYSKSDSLILFSQARSCSAEKSRPFDAHADGLVSSEGYVVMIVKTLARANVDGDRIHGVIRGIGISSDGRGRSLWAPRKEGQLEAVRRAYTSNVTPESVQYLEAHATSTQVGDATELDALSDFFQRGSAERKIPLGSVKSNIGHTLESAGLASLLKVLLCMRHGRIVPTINFDTPNPDIQWAKNPFTPIVKSMAWPDLEHLPRRAAVNAFGIGGLNAHVVVDGPVERRFPEREERFRNRSPRNPKTGYRPPNEATSIAIIGRGVVVPGAFDVASYKDARQSGQSQLMSPPLDRVGNSEFWETRPAIRQARQSGRAGYVHGYQYDWRQYHIPPKQIEQGNPLQFMLLDVAQQAMVESGYHEKNFDRSRAVVVVGTLFGGDFSHRLQVGLRLPEILDHLSQSLAKRNWTPEQIDKALSESVRQIVKKYPAIQDETGSFTSSTLASRVAKTLDVMGGAFAIDASDCSSLAAIQLAQHLLTAGLADTVFCAAAHRDLGPAGWEAWNHRRSEESLNTGDEEVSRDPGEGVVMLMLRRLKDARQDGQKIFGIIRDVTAEGTLSTSMTVARNGRGVETNQISEVPRRSSSDSQSKLELIKQFGDLQHAANMLEIFDATMRSTRGTTQQQRICVSSTAGASRYNLVMESSMTKEVEVPRASQIHMHNGTSVAPTNAAQTIELPQVSRFTNGAVISINGKERHETNGDSRDPKANVVVLRNSDSADQQQIFRFTGRDSVELSRRLRRLLKKTDAEIVRKSVDRFAAGSECRLAIVTTVAELRNRLTEAATIVTAESQRKDSRDHGIYYSSSEISERPRWAAIFPGQGSYRAGVLEEFSNSSAAAAKIMTRADQFLTQFGLPTLSESSDGDDLIQGEEIGLSQVRMLVANVCAAAMLKEWVGKPEFVTGHSFGEYAALVATEALELESALAITLARAKAVQAKNQAGGLLLSIAAPAKEIRKLVLDQKDLFVSHINAPNQTVVAGVSEAIDRIEQNCKTNGFACVRVPVNCPYHSPLLSAAQDDLAVALAQHRWKSPRIPLLSTVSGRFVADRDEIIGNLKRQLVEPLNWVRHVERLIAEGVKVFVEVGPSQVLTKLTRQIIGDRPIAVVPIDVPSLDFNELRLRIQARIEVAGIELAASAIHAPVSLAKRLPKNRDRNGAMPLRGSNGSEKEQPQPAEPAKSTSLVAYSNGASAEAIIASGETETSPGTDPLDEFVIDLIVEQTGYPRDAIELDWDLEADLGIDSIRRAQILGELREYFDLAGTMELFSGLRTLRDIVSMLRTSPGKGDWLKVALRQRHESELAAPVNSDSLVSKSALETVSRDPISVTNESEAIETPSILHEIEEFLIDYVVDRTGYPRDAIDLDAEMESDLGIDSIVQAQLFGELQNQFAFTLSKERDKFVISGIHTLRQIRDLAAERTGASPGSAESKENVTPTDEKALANQVIAEKRAEITLSSKVATARMPAAQMPGDKHSNGTRRSNGRTVATAATENGRAWGARNQHAVRSLMYKHMDRMPFQSGASTLEASPHEPLTQIVEEEIKGVAEGAGVRFESLLRLRESLRLPISDQSEVSRPEDDLFKFLTPGGLGDGGRSEGSDSSTPSVTRRFRLEMSAAETRKWNGRLPDFAGGAIVVGDSPESHALSRRLKSFGVPVFAVPQIKNRDEAVKILEDIWKKTPSPHLFILSPRDDDAESRLDLGQWKSRGQAGIRSLYWFCQKWLSLVEESHLVEDASLIGTVSLGGDFGTSHSIHSVESGSLTGLFKAIIIECWMAGHRAVPIKVLDFQKRQCDEDVVNAICVELAEPSYDVEIGWDGTSRSVLRSIPEPIVTHGALGSLKPSGNWIVTGGARGITAYLVQSMAADYPSVQFHLLGTAPCPQLTDEIRRLASVDRAQLKTKVIREARKANRSPLKAWEQVEKAIEIDATLSRLKAAGIRSTYYQCDVADASQLAVTLESIRSLAGPIQGVIHGAGVGKDASFQRKDPIMVERCLAAKIDGGFNLIAQTKDDPLQAFIAFGSISGRFGANGHTDYSLANDTLAKLICWQRRLRPSVPASLFHWHAWGDIGMATKPETRLAMEMIGLQLMPAKEGAEHFLNELRSGLPLAEVVITDTKYYRMFYPADRMLTSPNNGNGDVQSSVHFPLITPIHNSSTDVFRCEATLDPTRDPFLIEHRRGDRPLLPMVIISELMAEGAAAARGKGRPCELRDLEIYFGMKFPTDTSRRVAVVSQKCGENSYATELTAEIVSRNGAILNPAKVAATATVEFVPTLETVFDELQSDADRKSNLEWQGVQYPTKESEFYLGPPLRCLRKFAIDPAKKCIWGRISAPSISELAGSHRDVSNWMIPSAVIDSSLFASGILAWSCVRPGITLPQKVERLAVRRLARPAELCWVRSQLVNVEDDRATFDITLWGRDDQPLLVIHKYVAAWLPS